MIDLPEIPALALTVVNLLAPYLVAIVNHPRWSPNSKRILAVMVSVLLSVVALLVVQVASGEPVESWVTLVILGILVSQTSYALVTKKSATALEKSVGIK